MYYKCLCNNEIINGYSSKLHDIIVKSFLEGEFKDTISIYFFINYILDYNIYINIKCKNSFALLIEKEIKKLPKDFSETLNFKLKIYNYLVYDEKVDLSFLLLKTRNKKMKNIIFEPLHDFYICFESYKKNYEALYNKLMLKIREENAKN